MARAAGPVLGRLDKASFVRYLRRVLEEVAKMEAHAAEHWRGVRKEMAEYPGRMIRYHLMNALGYAYGTRLVRAHVAPLLAEAERGGLEAAASGMEEAVRSFHWLASDVVDRMQTRSPAVILQAVEDLGPAIPVRIDWEEEIRRSRDVYYTDFHWDVIGELVGAANLLEAALVHHAVPERVAYHREGDFRFFVPERTLRTPRAERAALQAEVLEDANAEVRQLRYYGRRTAPLPDHPHFTLIMWSNGTAEWFVNPSQTMGALLAWGRGERSAALDSNEAVVPHPEYLVHPVVAEIEPHPLYELSFEARGRGEAMEPTTRNVEMVVSRMVRQVNPYAGRVDRILEEMRIKDLLGRMRDGDLDAALEFDRFLATVPGPTAAYKNLIGQWLSKERE